MTFFGMGASAAPPGEADSTSNLLARSIFGMLGIDPSQVGDARQFFAQVAAGLMDAQARIVRIEAMLMIIMKDMGIGAGTDLARLLAAARPAGPGGASAASPAPDHGATLATPSPGQAGT